jgi:hypothetical protein
LKEYQLVIVQQMIEMKIIIYQMKGTSWQWQMVLVMAEQIVYQMKGTSWQWLSRWYIR